jgi:Ribose/xylose/arabinose/galactoside ABC-type transport systems, permease components
MTSSPGTETLNAPVVLANRAGVVRRFFTHNALWVGLVVLVAALAIASPTFRSPVNLTNILAQNGIIGVVACGMLVMMISGGFDMSVGASGGLIMVTTAFVSATAGIGAGIAAALIAGAVVGALNGIVITRFRLNSFIATLATASVISGATLVLTNAAPVTGDVGFLRGIAFGSLLGIPYFFLIFLVFAVITHLLLTRTKVGHWIHATGANRSASFLSGVPVSAVSIAAFTFGGIAVGVASVLLFTQSGIGQPTAASAWPLSAIAICVIGGTSLSGGIGRVSNIIAAVLILGVVSNGLNQLGISTYWQPIVTGLVILIAVIADQISTRNKRS